MIGALIASAASAQPQTPPPQGDSNNTTYDANPANADVGQAAPTAYTDSAPVYVRGLNGYGRQAWRGETSPGADIAVRLRGFADPTTSVTAAPNPNNMSDQIPSRGPDYDGVPPGTPY
jgi:hypothetical protein